MNLHQEWNHARACEAEGRTADAVKIYRKILKLSPKNPRANQRMGVLAARSGDHKLAARYLKVAVQMNREDADSWEKLGDAYSGQNRLIEAIKAYESALKVTDARVRILCKLGDIHRRSGDLNRAEHSFRDALGIDPQHAFATIGLGQVKQDRLDFVGAIRTYGEASAFEPHGTAAMVRMKKLLDVSVQPWHFPMMSDHARNAAYDAAIRATIQPGDTVLDIGCGAGLLSMMAARAGAAQVFACDDNVHITQITQSIVAKNGFSDKIKVINKRSTDLRIGVDMPQRANVLVCEIFDVTALGEDALQTIRHAMAHLLTPDARIIPQSVDIYAAPVESTSLRQRYSVSQSCGFDLSDFNLLADRRCLQVPLIHEGYRTLSSVQKTLSIPFDQSLQLVGGHRSSFPIEADGRLDGFVLWYTLNLGQGHVLSTAPNKNMTHWKQGFLPHWSGPTMCRSGDTLTCTTQYRRQLLWIDALGC